MKKIFTLLTMALLAIGASAQKITFSADDIASAGDWSQGKEFSNGDFKITLADDQKKMAIDENKAYFGTADSYEKFTHRLKSGAKSQGAGKLCQISVTIPSNGDLKVYVRTGSNSATDRNLVIAQNGEPVFNQVIQESQAVSVEMEENIDADKNPTGATNVYPVVSVKVTAGTALITFPTGSMNFYGFEFVSDGTTVLPADPHAATVWDFTKLSETDIANLAADANWAYDEEKSRYTYGVAFTSAEGKQNDIVLKANGQELDIVKGLFFGRDGTIDANKFGIDEGKGINLPGAKYRVILTELAKNDKIEVRLTGSSDGDRGVALTNVGTDNTLTSTDKAVAEGEFTVAEDGSVIIETTGGLTINALAINADLPVASGISTIKAETTTDAPVYNLQGQRVDASYRGVVIQNGKKAIQK